MAKDDPETLGVHWIYACIHNARVAMTDALVMGNLERVEELDRQMDRLLKNLVEEAEECPNPSKP